MASNDAERLDGDVLGEQVGDDALPGTGDFPRDQALGVNDPNLVAPDDVATREARRRADHGPSEHERSGDLLPPDGDDGHTDREQQVLASEGHGDTAPPPAEVAAVRIADAEPSSEPA